uniref:Uncharacterized protein n=1 Tax=Tetranychus urticae TaxID=32264 RepID=T1JVW2_TETUR
MDISTIKAQENAFGSKHYIHCFLFTFMDFFASSGERKKLKNETYLVNSFQWDISWR